MRFKPLLLILALLAGCSSPGVLVSRQIGEVAPVMGRAPADGSYGLFIAGQQQDLYDVPLRQGDPLGFDWEQDGEFKLIDAVAGTYRIRLDLRQTYEWRRLQDAENPVMTPAAKPST